MGFSQKLVSVSSKITRQLTRAEVHFSDERCLCYFLSYIFLSYILFFRFLGILKFTLLCDIFTKHKSDLSREERQEIIQHSRKR